MAPDRDPDANDNATTDERGGRPRVTGPQAFAPGPAYRLGEQLGRGGMGEVIAAHDETLDRDVAIKRMLGHDSRAVARFIREAKIQARLDHPAIPPVHELARAADGTPYFVMRRLTGTPLSKVLAGHARGDAAMVEKFSSTRMLRAFADACLAVAFAHTRGVIHRDLKPANIMLGDFGEVFVIDWGVAKVIGETDPTSSGDDEPGDQAVTRAGTVIGTKGFMSPEQLAGATDLDGRVDVYALGCVLFEILAGMPFHAARETDRTASANAFGRHVPPELDDACFAATAAAREDRLASARELGERVQRYLDGDRDLALRKRLAGEHLARARSARTEADDATAMREASRAIALDPELREAVELVSRLMLEPPRETPREVAEQVAAERREVSRRLAGFGTIAYAYYAALLIYLSMMGLESAGYLIAIAATVAVLFANSYLNYRRGVTRLGGAIAIAANGVLFALLGRVLSPFTIVTGLAAVSTVLFTTSPAYRTRGALLAIGVVFSGSPLLAYGLELAGVLSPTVTFTGGAMQLSSPMMELDGTMLNLGIVGYVPLIITALAVIALRVSRKQDDSSLRLHLQAWRLRQLVPA